MTTVGATGGAGSGVAAARARVTTVCATGGAGTDARRGFFGAGTAVVVVAVVVAAAFAVVVAAAFAVIAAAFAIVAAAFAIVATAAVVAVAAAAFAVVVAAAFAVVAAAPVVVVACVTGDAIPVAVGAPIFTAFCVGNAASAAFSVGGALGAPTAAACVTEPIGSVTSVHVTLGGSELAVRLTERREQRRPELFCPKWKLYYFKCNPTPTVCMQTCWRDATSPPQPSNPSPCW